MSILNVLAELARSKKITWQIIDADNVINWVLGISLILVPDFFNRLLFGHEVISHWIYIALGLSLLWLAIWQVDNFIKMRQLSVPALRFMAFLSWIGALGLILVLVSALGGRMLLFSKAVLWLIEVILLIKGGWCWWMAEQIK